MPDSGERPDALVDTSVSAPLRRTPAVVSELLTRNFPGSRFLSAEAAAELLRDAPRLGIAGGAIYDGLVAACARQHGLALVTRDRRALDTYRALEIELRTLS